MAKNTKSAKKKQNTSVVWLAPIVGVLGIVPLLVHLHAYHSGLTKYDFFDSEEIYKSVGYSTDFFLYYKMVFFCVFAGIAAAILVVKLIKEGREIKFSKIFIPLGVYALLATVSSVASKYKPYPFTGIYEQFEPLWAILGYAVVAYYAFLYVNSYKDITVVLGALTFSTFILLLVGMSQAFFTDFYQTKLGLKLMLPADWPENVPVTFNFQKGRVYLSLYNPNYVGSYVALLAPVFLMLVFACKKVYMKLIFLAFYISLLLSLLGSQSRAGFVGVILSVVLIGALFGKNLLKNWFPVAAILIVVVGSVYTYDNYNNGAIVNKVKSAFNFTESDFNLTNIETLEDEAVLTYKGSDLHVSYSVDMALGDIGISITDWRGEAVEAQFNPDDYSYTLTDPRFEKIVVSFCMVDASTLGLSVKVDRHEWVFANASDGYRMMNGYGKLIKAQHSDTFEPMEKYGRVASGRFFIWARTLPLLKKHIFLGSGADTFVLEFPNYDFLSLYNGGYSGQIMTKPHNMYLQIAVQTGLLSLIAMLVFYGWYFIHSCRIVVKLKKHSPASLIGMGILAGSFGYMFVQVINDSSITVAPLYWTLLGVGLACMELAKKEDSES